MAAVAISFVLLLWLPQRLASRNNETLLPPIEGQNKFTIFASNLSFLFLVFLIWCGFDGTSDPLANPLPLTIWTLWWVGITLAHCLFGNIWALINPWSGPLYLIRIWYQRNAILTPPSSIGYWIAIVIFSAFAWFELVDLAPEDPRRLATVVLFYWLFTTAACLLCGEDFWMKSAEPFSVFFRLISHCSIFCRSNNPSKKRLTVCLPGYRFIQESALPLSGVLFVLLTLSTVSFDGFSKTFLWLGAIDINPLAYPGRSAVMVANSLGLIAAFVCLASIYFFCVFVGCQLACRPRHFKVACGRLIYSIIPISLVFHFAHYLTALLTNGQYALLAFNDPLEKGWNLLGIKGYLVSTSFLNNLHSVSIIWTVQTVAIVIGHIVGLFIAHIIAMEIFVKKNPTVLSQLAMVVLMVGYTSFGLWLLSTPSIG